jgi:hypothetical protein
MKTVGPNALTFIALWWPLPFLPGVWWPTAIFLGGLTFAGLIALGLEAVTPKQKPLKTGSSRVHYPTLRAFGPAFLALEVILFVHIRTFGGGREGTDPYAEILAPIADIIVSTLPKFRKMAETLVEMGVGERGDLIVVAWAIAYLGQVAIALLWVPVFWRNAPHAWRSSRLRELRWYHFVGFWIVMLFVLPWALLWYPEVGDVRSRREIFGNFERNDVELFYRTLFYSFFYWQGLFGLILLTIVYPLRRDDALR